MIQLPWQVVACAVAWLGIVQIMYYMRHTGCEERMELREREIRRDEGKISEEVFRKIARENAIRLLELE